jgi:hypothetical protein
MIDEMEAVGFLSAADAAELLEVAGPGAGSRTFRLGS